MTAYDGYKLIEYVIYIMLAYLCIIIAVGANILSRKMRQEDISIRSMIISILCILIAVWMLFGSTRIGGVFFIIGVASSSAAKDLYRLSEASGFMRRFGGKN